MKLILIGGLPGSGKSTLATLLAARYRLPVLAKDPIKEALMDSLGAPVAPSSRTLSNAAFAIQFRLAAPCLAVSRGLILEGNFRPVEHRDAIAGLLGRVPGANLIQVLCRIDDSERRRRLTGRRQSGSRHPGHQELSAGVLEDRTSDAFMDLPGLRLTYAGGDGTELFEALDQRLSPAD